MSQDVFVAGVGMIPFTKPGAGEPYPQMAAKATRQALADAGIGYEQVQQAYVGYVYGDSTAGQNALYEVGLSGIPIRRHQQQVADAVALQRVEHQLGTEGRHDGVRVAFAFRPRESEALFDLGVMVETGGRSGDCASPRTDGKRPQPSARPPPMLRPPVTISIAFVKGMVAGVSARGHACDPLLAEAGIPPALLHEPGAR